MITKRAPGEPDAPAPEPSGERVIIVDDDPVLVEALRDVLNEEGYRVEGYTEAARALERLCAGDLPSLVLLDYIMPTMNGAQFLDALAGAGVDVPIVLLSAMTDSRLPSARVAGVIKKPFELDELLSELARLRRATM